MKKIVTLCASFRFWSEMQAIGEKLELENGWVILTPVPHVLDRALTDHERALLGELHFSRIDLSDAIFVVNVGGYIGQAVAAEIEYAKQKGKEIIYLET